MSSELVLLLDDDPGTLLLQRRALERKGFRVVTAQTPAEAWALLDEHEPDLLVLDYRLGGDLTGLGFYEQVRERKQELPAILVTGFSDERRLMEALRSGMRDVVPKTEGHLEYLPLAVRRVLQHVTAERQLLETEMLRRAERHLRAVLNSMFPFVGVLSPDGVLLDTNRAPLVIANLQSAEVVGQPFWDTYWWSYSPAVQERLRDAVAGARSGVPSRYDVQIRVADGRLLPVDFMLSPMPDPSGAITHLIASAVDLTDRTRAEEALRKSEATARRQLAELEATYATAPVGLCVLDTDLRFVRLNAKLVELFGGDQAADVGRTIRDVMPTIADALEPTLQRVLATAQPMLHQEVAGESFTPSGTRRVWRLSAFPLRAGDDTIAGVNVVAEEITAQKLAEGERQQLYDRALEANRQKDEFLAMLSHELRTPLNVIIGYAAMLPHRLHDETFARRALASISNGSEGLKRIVEDLLDTSAIMNGKIRLDLDTVELTAVVTDVVDGLKPAANARRIQLVCGGSAPLPVVADRQRLRQVLWNLVANAVKFTEEGGRVEVVVGQEDTAATVRVTDTGIGIDPRFLPFVFERFRQAESSTSRTHGGLGLGLAIARELAGLMGGTIAASSDGVGRGSTFSVSLPLAAGGNHAGVATLDVS